MDLDPGLKGSPTEATEAARTDALKRGEESNPPHVPSERPSIFQYSRFAFYTILLTIASTFLIPFMFLYLHETDLKIAQVISEHFTVFVALPWAGGATSVIVMMYQFHPGEFVFKFFGFELRGGAAPALLWVICFLAGVLAVKVLW